MFKLIALWAAVAAALLLALITREEKLAARGKVPVGRLRRFWPRSERRRAPRYRVNWIIRYERLEPPPIHAGGETRDVSQTGAGLTISEKLPIGAVIRLEVTPPTEDRFLQVTAEVVWLKEVPTDGARQFFVGIRFRDLEGEEEKRMTRALHGHPSF